MAVPNNVCSDRPALYEAYHEIHNLDRLDSEDTVNSHIVGPICESGKDTCSDTLASPTTHAHNSQGMHLAVSNDYFFFHYT